MSLRRPHRLIAISGCAAVAALAALGASRAGDRPDAPRAPQRATALGLLHATWCPKRLGPRVALPIPRVREVPEYAAAKRSRREGPRIRDSRIGRLNDIGRKGPIAKDVAKSPQWSLRFEPGIEKYGYDPMIAVGNKYVIVTQDHEIGFFDRAGQPLAAGPCVPTKLSAMEFFTPFWAPTDASGGTNLNNINRYLGFPRNPPKSCNVNQVPPASPCVNEFYDTRVIFEPVKKRFVIVSAVRNGVWETGAETDVLARRYVALAVSKTEDPRDGFNQYMTTAGNYGDFPRVIANAGSLVIALNKIKSGGRAADVFAFDDLAAGKPDPANFTYYASVTGGRVVPVTHYGASGDRTFLVRTANDDKKTIEIFAMPKPASYTSPPPLQKTTVTLKNALSSFGVGPTYRAGRLYFTCSVLITPRVAEQTPARYSVRLVRVPVEQGAGTITASASAAKGYLDWFFGRNSADDAPTDLVSYERPAVAVGKDETLTFVYGRVGVTTQAMLFPEVRYSVWYKGEAKQRGSRLLQKGDFQPTWVWEGESVATAQTYECEGCKNGGGIDYSTAVVDPTDDKTVWVVHGFGDADDAGWRTVVGKIVP